MKKLLIVIFALFVFWAPVLADYSINLEQFLNGFFSVVVKNEELPKSFEYIQLKYKNVNKWTKLYKNLQKAVYLDLFPNANIELPLGQKLTQLQVTNIIKKWFDFIETGDARKIANIDWLRDILLDIQNKQIDQSLYNWTTKNDNADLSNDIDDITSSPLFKDILVRLNSTYISSGSLDEKAMLYGSLKWLVDWLHDPYTSFFPPTEAKSFDDQLQGEYFGIGAYVEMNKPGKLIITAPIVWSPAEKAWLKWWDRVIKINDHIVTEEYSLDTVISWIKWPAKTTVILKIMRDGKVIEISVIRDKIVIKNIETKIYDSWTKWSICYVGIHMFDMWVANDFDTAMQETSKYNCTKYVFDLRNNPGGSLEEVADMLNYFVPNKETSILIKSKFENEEIISSQPKYKKLTWDTVRVIINKWSASASEIFAWVIKDYISKALIIGENSFGKWSVQNLLNYSDWSMLKYTVAKRYTGKSKTWIDHIGFAPDVKIIDNTGTVIDEILEYALKN